MITCTKYKNMCMLFYIYQRHALVSSSFFKFLFHIIYCMYCGLISRLFAFFHIHFAIFASYYIHFAYICFLSYLFRLPNFLTSLRCEYTLKRARGQRTYVHLKSVHEVYKSLRLLKDVSFITLHLAFQSVIFTLKL